jgi:hypothetical protein
VPLSGFPEEFFGELNFVGIHFQDQLSGDGFYKITGFIPKLLLIVVQQVIKHGMPPFFSGQTARVI